MTTANMKKLKEKMGLLGALASMSTPNLRYPQENLFYAQCSGCPPLPRSSKPSGAASAKRDAKKRRNIKKRNKH